MKNIAILGSTGSIGTQTLDVVRRNPELFHISALAANKNISLMAEQIKEFQPDKVVMADEDAAQKLTAYFNGRTNIEGGREALIALAADSKADIVVTSLLGFAGLEPTLAAIEAGKDIALANKETLVVAGELVMAAAKKKGVSVLPVDSEHCALFQCLHGENRAQVEKLILTASGGPFRSCQKQDLINVSWKECLKHPTWSMGKKITIDSATMVNKGLEVIEAKWLYGVSYDQIEVVVHPESIVHSMVQYHDGAVLAQLGMPDMRLPIQYALTYPQREKSAFPRLDFSKLQELHFSQPDMDTFRGLGMAYAAGRKGGTIPCVFNAANEAAVEAFLSDECSFLDIYDIIDRVLQMAVNKQEPDLQDLLQADEWARQQAAILLKNKKQVII